jgi:hypothetical protein
MKPGKGRPVKGGRHRSRSLRIAYSAPAKRKKRGGDSLRHDRRVRAHRRRSRARDRDRADAPLCGRRLLDGPDSAQRHGIRIALVRAGRGAGGNNIAFTVIHILPYHRHTSGGRLCTQCDGRPCGPVTLASLVLCGRWPYAAQVVGSNREPSDCPRGMWHHRRRVFCIDADSEFSQLIAAYRGIAVRIPSARCRGQNIFSRPVGRHVNSPSKWLPSFRRRLRSMAISRRPSRFARRHPRDLLPRALPRTPSSWSFSRFRSHRRLRSRSKRKLLLRHPMRIRRSRPRLLPRRFPDRRPCPRRPRRQKRQRPPPIIPGRLSPRSNNGPLRSRGGELY